MARTVLTRANSFLAFSICRNHQFSCIDDDPCLLSVLVNSCYVCFCAVALVLVCGVVCVCVCVCVRVCTCVCVHVCVCVRVPTCTTTFTYHVLLNIRTEYRHCSQWRLMHWRKKSCLSRTFLRIACHHIHIQPALPHAPTTTTYIPLLPPPPPPPPQCKLLYAQVVLGKRPPVQVAEGNHHKCKVSVCTSC